MTINTDIRNAFRVHEILTESQAWETHASLLNLTKVEPNAINRIISALSLLGVIERNKGDTLRAYRVVPGVELHLHKLRITIEAQYGHRSEPQIERPALRTRPARSDPPPFVKIGPAIPAPTETAPVQVAASIAERIRFQSSRGMSDANLKRIYGSSAVHAALNRS